MLALEQSVLRMLFGVICRQTRSLNLPYGVDEQLVLKVARHHRLSPCLSVTCVNGASPALLDLFDRDRLVTLGRGTLLRHTLVDFSTRLARVGVETIVLKGMAYEAMAYPVPGTRPATDIDVLVRPADRSVTLATFRTLGFVPMDGGPGFDDPDYHELSLRRGDVSVDLHFGLAPFIRGAIDYEALWAAKIRLPVDGAPTYSLSRPHAALHQGLHMAIHHFDVPGLYLLDLVRLCAEPLVSAQAKEAARIWRCARAWETATALAASFVPNSTFGAAPNGGQRARVRRIVAAFGGLQAVPRAEQLRRKIAHFDLASDAVKYLASQGRRVLRQKVVKRLGDRRSPAQRLHW